MYRIKNLRLIRRMGVKVVKGAFGRLGGNERLIIAINNHEKKDVQALVQYVLAGLLTDRWSLTFPR